MELDCKLCAAKGLLIKGCSTWNTALGGIEELLLMDPPPGGIAYAIIVIGRFSS